MRFLSFLFAVIFSFSFSQTLFAKSPKEELLKIDLYVMGQCPFGTELENTLAMAREEIKRPIETHFYYIVNETPAGDFQSVHGPSEVEEDMRQLVIQKYHPQQFWKYLKSRNSDYRKPDWKPHAYWAGLSPQEIEKKIQEEGKTLLKENSQKARQMGIGISPTLFISGTLYQGNRSLPAIVRALSQNSKTDQQKLPECFSDADCVSPSPTESGRCVSAGTPKAKCESLTVLLKIITPTADFPLDPTPLQTFAQQVPNLKPVKQMIPWDSPEGKEWLKKIPVPALPLYVWGDTFALLEVIPTLQNHGVLKAQEVPDGRKVYWLSPDFVQPTFYQNRPPQLKHLDLFVMSQCPFGTLAENQILPIAHREGIQVEIHYIIDERPTNPSDPGSLTLGSLHGPAELEEDYRQVCVQKYFPDRHFAYLDERNKNFQSSFWDQSALKVLGEDSLVVIRNCVANEGKSLLLQKSQLTKELNIYTSPTVLWENRHRFNKLSELKKSVGIFSQIELKEGGCAQQ